MTKKIYCPMTIEHEALEMNQAVAGNCAYTKMSEIATCEDCCDVLDNFGYHNQHHSWKVYGKKTAAGEWANDAIGISIGDAEAYGRVGQYTSTCYTSPSGKITDGAAVRQTSNVRVGYFDPCHENQTITYVTGFSYGADDTLVYNSMS